MRLLKKSRVIACVTEIFNTRNSRELVGKTGLCVDVGESPILFNNNLMRIRFNENLALPAFINAQFQTNYVQQQLDRIKRGTTSVFAIYFRELKDIELVLPNILEQRDFVEKLELLRSIVGSQLVAMAKVTATFNSLLANFFPRVAVSSPLNADSDQSKEVISN